MQTILSGVVLGHVACKYIYVRLFRGSDKMHSRTLLSVGSWVGICLAVWVVAWVVAESIPVFNNLLSLIVRFDIVSSLVRTPANGTLQSALFGSWFSCMHRLFSLIIGHYTDPAVGLPAIFWLHMNWGIYFRDIKKTFLTVCNTLILGIACAIVSFLRQWGPD